MSALDTIFAVSSGAGRAGVCVFRLSGPDTRRIVEALTGRRKPKARYASLETFIGPDQQPIDKGLLIFFKGPASFTGEDSAEFHTHGSEAVIIAMSEAFLKAGARQAGPGEFTRRAFDHGKMDLTEAEGLADLIDAQTDGQRRQAFRQMDGGLRAVYDGWREGLIDALAAIEGEIDFPDEQDVPDALSHAAYEPLSRVILDMERALKDGIRGEKMRSGIHVAILGPPNAGKSTLLNRLAQREAAIVSDQAGTTRDVIEVQVNIAGIPVSVADTAGLRDASDDIEAEGVRRARGRAAEADLRIGVMSGDTLEESGHLTALLQSGDLLLLNKLDQTKFSGPDGPFKTFAVSAKDGTGFDKFYQALETIIISRFALTENPGLTRARHKDCTERAVSALTRGRGNLASAPELAGDDVRAALHAIKELAGEADIEAVLGAIFARFCIGK